jgi:hypothetical protein
MAHPRTLKVTMLLPAVLVFLFLSLEVSEAAPTPPVTEAAALEGLLDLTLRASKETAPVLFALGTKELIEAHGWEAGTCDDVLKAYATASVEMKATLVAHEWKGCDASCPGRLTDEDALWKALAAERSDEGDLRITLESCDAQGPDPVFTGALASSREKIGWMGYIVQRMAFEMVQDKAGESPALVAKIESAKAHVVAGLVARP